MTERELLELAAKAADYKYMNNALWDGRDVVEYSWNPLEDDGQALKLAVKLKLAFSAVNPRFIEAAIFKDGEAQMTFRYGTEDSEWNYDPYDAARRAIVRAAAEIGKEK